MLPPAPAAISSSRFTIGHTSGSLSSVEALAKVIDVGELVEADEPGRDPPG